MEYLDGYLIRMLNKFTDVTNEKESKEWNLMQKDIESLYDTWNTVSIDLHSANIEGSNILEFSNNLNESTQNIKKQNKELAMESIVKLYNLLPQYSEVISPNSKETNILKIKSFVTTAYVNVSNDEWQEAQTNLSQAVNLFTNLLNSVGQNFDNESAISQCYVLVNELISAVMLEDKDIFYIEYKNLVEKMANL